MRNNINSFFFLLFIIIVFLSFLLLLSSVIMFWCIFVLPPFAGAAEDGHGLSVRAAAALGQREEGERSRYE